MENQIRYLGLALTAVTTGMAYAFIEEVYTKYKARHPRFDKLVFVNPKSDTEVFMNFFGYIQRDLSIGEENPNPRSLLGKIASRKRYFKSSRGNLGI